MEEIDRTIAAVHTSILDNLNIDNINIKLLKHMFFLRVQKAYV